ncbi:MAG: IS110 family transposase [Romboutsia sp.]|uniref:IS110 family transposase n=1 Tax=Romboutsia sp. TaxID=1965302 RepID=UPI003F3F5BD8
MNNNIIKLNKSRIFIGVDLSKTFHVAKAMDINGTVIGTLSKLDNYYEAFSGFKTWVTNMQVKANAETSIIGMEPTGIYWQNLASYITNHMPDSEAVFVKQEKVKITRKLYGNGKGKNDFIDSLAIARCVRENNCFYINNQSKEYNDFKALSRHRDDKLKRQSYIFNKLDNHIPAVFEDYHKVFKSWSSGSFTTIISKYPLPQDIATASEEELLKQLRTRVSTGVGLKKIRQLKEVATNYIQNRNDNLYGASDNIYRMIIIDLVKEYQHVQDQINELDECLANLVSEVSYSQDLLAIDGIGTVTTSAFIAEVGDIMRFETAKNLISYVGFDLKECSSGKHKGTMTISKCGSRKLRNILYKATLPLITKNKYFKVYYNYLISRLQNPLKKKQALIAVCCKFLKCVFGMVKNNQKFNGLEIFKGLNLEIAA